ncbi:MAG TPA: radical SAM protein [Verrucomicrobiae bacterium]|nr:radical SAM protein [Verrucomicrobiae bacterium]
MAGGAGQLATVGTSAPSAGSAPRPHVVSWEVTRACQLHCRHCRARALRRRDPGELSLAECQHVLDDLADGFERPPVLVLTGGDPLERDDLESIIAGGVARGITVALAPSVTPRLTPEVVRRWRDLGATSVALSLDGAGARVHDRFRGVVGTFERTREVARAVVATGLRLQFNTAVGNATAATLPAVGRLVTQLGATSWECFFVIPTGRARPRDCLTAPALELWLGWLARWAARVPFRVTAVGAPQYIRVSAAVTPQSEPARPIVREARGFAFIDHRGDVFPSGYLPVAGGNVRDRPLSSVYQESDLFRALRDPTQLRGGCAACSYREVCGGSRARAYAATGDYLASDPGCPLSLAPTA